jgi:hypothetical protein
MWSKKPTGDDKPCRVCAERFLPKPWQVSKSDYECPRCKRARSNLANETRDLSAYAARRYPSRAEYHRAYYQKRRLDAEYLRRRKARRVLAYAIETGRVAKTPCERCGSMKPEGHHVDYARPLDVHWFCRRCHMKMAHRMDIDAMLAARTKGVGA